MGVRWPWAEHGGAQGPPGPCTAKPMSRALTLLGERATYQSRAQRAADLILGQTPSCGKVKKVALTACIHKFLTILNAMLKQRTPWQPQEVQS